MYSMRFWIQATAVIGLSLPLTLLGQSTSANPLDVVDQLSPVAAGQINQAAERILAETGTPSASVAIVEDGKIVYTHGYGLARLNPPTPAEPSMRYSIGSISKQFTAAAILLLEQQGKLSLNDPVSKYFPDLTDARHITIRMLLSHTSGYQDFWPEDYVMPPMEQPTTPQHILDVWGKKPLDFTPGTRWQYSNTNFVIAGLIVEKVSGEPLFTFLEKNIFTPLHMARVWDSDQTPLSPTDAAGYVRHALGPQRPAPPEGAGWMLGAAELAMPAYDLGQWDISLMDRSLLSAESYRQFFAPVMLKDGTNSGYALGLFVGSEHGHPYLEHSGEVSGFVSENIVFPKSHAAIVVLTNEMASPAASAIARAITPFVLAKRNPAETQAMQVLLGLEQGKIDRAEFTAWCNAYFNPQTLADYQTSLAPLGAPASIIQTDQSLRGGMTFRAFRVTFPNGKHNLNITTFTEPDGKLEQFLVLPVPEIN